MIISWLRLLSLPIWIFTVKLKVWGLDFSDSLMSFFCLCVFSCVCFCCQIWSGLESLSQSRQAGPGWLWFPLSSLLYYCRMLPPLKYLCVCSLTTQTGKKNVSLCTCTVCLHACFPHACKGPQTLAPPKVAYLKSNLPPACRSSVRDNPFHPPWLKTFSQT